LELFKLVEQQKLPTIWLGDLLDTKEVIRGKCLNTAVEYFRTSKLSHNVLVVDKPFNFQNIVMVPYIHDKTKLKTILTQFENTEVTLIGHLELSNFDFGNGHVCTNGLSFSDVAGFKRVISGHFHKYQTKGNLTYLGTPFSHSFGEANQTKYLATYDSVTDVLDIFETPFHRHISFEFNCDNLSE